MGTRHLIAVMKDGEYKVAQYGQWDGYPEGQGVAILQFLSDGFDKHLFGQKLSDVSFITEPEYAQIWREFGVDIDASDYVSLEIMSLFKDRYPEFSRDTGSKILPLIMNSEKLKLQNSIGFAADSLFCEWAYVLDLDKNTFEVFKGVNKETLGHNERFASFESHSNEYYQVKLSASFDIDNLPSEREFLERFEG